MCGKNIKDMWESLTVTGSPPRVREKLFPINVCSFCDRITPACAGKTRYQRAAPLTRWDHPRVCGKNAKGIGDGLKSAGSPPRVREKLYYDNMPDSEHRITPACAGKTSSQELLKNHCWDHPRVCEKNAAPKAVTNGAAGSPPRVREKLVPPL